MLWRNVKQGKSIKNDRDAGDGVLHHLHLIDEQTEGQTGPTAGNWQTLFAMPPGSGIPTSP